MKLLNIDRKTLIFSFIIIILILINILAVSHCSNISATSDNNIIALTDSIKYFKGKNGALVAQKTMLNGDMSLLKHVNDSLYNIIKNIGVKSPDNVVYSKITITDIKHDTVWTQIHDTVSDKSKSIYNINKKFKFSDSYHTLAGNTWFNTDGVADSLGLSIDTNTVVADFTIVQKDNKVYITSNNPYIKYNNIIGINNTKKKRFGIGPVIGVGINQKVKVNPYIGFGIMYNIFLF